MTSIGGSPNKSAQADAGAAHGLVSGVRSGVPDLGSGLRQVREMKVVFFISECKTINETAMNFVFEQQ